MNQEKVKKDKLDNLNFLMVLLKVKQIQKRLDKKFEEVSRACKDCVREN